MADNFDATAEASKIKNMAFSCLDDNSTGLTIKAANTEAALAKEVASLWGTPDKLIAVASELQHPTWSFTQFSRVDTGKQPTDVTGVDFQALNWIYPSFAMNIRNTDGNVVVTVGGTNKKDDLYQIDNVVETVSSPIRHEQ